MSQPEKMRALIQKGEGYSGSQTGPDIDSATEWLEMAEIPTPKPADNQVLIRVIMASVNPSDIHFIKGEYGQPRVKGAPAGFEGVGEVVAGQGVFASNLIGQRVAFVATASGAWAEYALTDAATCIPLRPDISDTDGAAQIVNPLTAMAMFDIVRDSGGESFVVTAAGSQLGKLLIGLGRDAGVAPIATIRRAEQAEALKELGAAEALDTTAGDFLDRFRAIVKERKPRILLDAVGDQNAADMFFAMPSRTRWINYGKLSSEPPRLDELGQLIFMEKRIEGFWLTKWLRSAPRGDQARIAREVQARFADGRWKTDVTEVLPLSEALEKLPVALSVPDGKVMIRP